VAVALNAKKKSLSAAQTTEEVKSEQWDIDHELDVVSRIEQFVMSLQPEQLWFQGDE
jgi:hypothetical protein